MFFRINNIKIVLIIVIIFSFVLFLSIKVCNEISLFSNCLENDICSHSTTRVGENFQCEITRSGGEKFIFLGKCQICGCYQCKLINPEISESDCEEYLNSSISQWIISIYHRYFEHYHKPSETDKKFISDYQKAKREGNIRHVIKIELFFE